VQVYEKDVVSVANYNHDAPSSSNGGMGTGPPRLTSTSDLRVPHIVGSSRNYEARCKREYCSNTHLYFIHSVSMCTDQMTFMTADDLSIYLWDLERPESSMRSLDIRPAIPDESEVLSPVPPHFQGLHIELALRHTCKRVTVRWTTALYVLLP
jgi:serine/threonine-protein phosphatase 2A regulatory subunit B